MDQTGRCLKHDVDLIDTDDKQWRGKLRICPVKGCNMHELISGKRRQPKLPGLDPGRQYREVRQSEAALVRQAVQWGGLTGYEVLEIGQQIHYLRCPSCRSAIRSILCPACLETFPPALFSQSTTGAPDTFWTRPEWGNTWRGVEWKKHEAAPVRPEQQRLVSLGLVDLAWSLEMLQAILRGE